ncbi:hypothetical protein F4553_006751 [Allocatelliglobosispora scoriae]|uniref:Lipoprotein n=1 Tax=Allocatelliglobosispora scoriae TaxID=643052 RepID=A0A841BW35_9ACTN|nr:hypothetical protein [Allocatelliglobosispora scoriae]MBB5873317.1 hypothetical protein [Allocatelliglobosispora scoriae]
MPYRPSTALQLTAAVALVSLLAGCPKDSPDSSSPTVSTQLSPSPSPAKPLAAAPTCAEIKGSIVRGLIDPYYAFGKDGAPLTEGIFSGEDGLNLVVQQPCTTGDLGGEIGNVTVGTIMNSIVDTTGRTWSVMLCTKGADRAQCVVHFALGDRDPIESVTVADKKLTLVYLTRPADGPAAGVSIKRTAIYATDGTILKEQSHTDAPYTP